MKVIVVLGAPNDEQGRLCLIARERLKAAFALWKEDPRARILLTGGWGRHFNTAPRPHAFYARCYLEDLGVDSSCFLPFAESSNTLEDARLCHPILRRTPASEVTVVTSDFHRERAALIFETVFDDPAFQLNWREAPHQGSQEEIEALRTHEKEAIARFRSESAKGPSD